MILDAHCHLDLLENPLYRISELKDSNMSVLAVGTTPKAYLKEAELCRNANNIRVALGLHPELVGSEYADLRLFAKLAKETSYIGEVGLDFRKEFKDNKEQQIAVFTQIIDLCEMFAPKVISVHSLRSVNMVVKILQEHVRSDNNIYILHWYTGSLTQLEAAVDFGCFFSVNPRMLKSKSGSEIIRSIPIDRMLLETDAPFGAKYKSMYDIESELRNTANQISKIRGIDVTECICNNSKRILVM